MVPPLDYETLKLIWWALMGFLLIGFAVMDGFDFGVGALIPFAGKTDDERRVMINSIGPVWEGNQVWFVLAGGALFAAWPTLYATAFSALYVGMFLVLAALIIRPVSLVYRSKNPSPLWRSFWDWGLFISGVLPPFLFGVVMGNVLQGVPFEFDLDMRATYGGGFLSLLNPFGLLAGVISVAMIVQQGAAWLCIKTDGDVQARSIRFGSISGFIGAASFALAGLMVWFGLINEYAIQSGVDPSGPAYPLSKTVVLQSGAWMVNFWNAPWMWLAPIVGVGGMALAAIMLRASNGRLALVINSAAITGVIATQGFAMFPFLLPSSSHLASSLTVWDASSSHLTLFIMLVAAIIFMPLIIAYTSWVYYIIRGKVNLEALLGSKESY